jgi:heterodisulfide reductase subunit A-like polyferredoxin
MAIILLPLLRTRQSPTKPSQSPKHQLSMAISTLLAVAYDVLEYSPGVQGSAKDPVHTEVVVVGAGLSGISAIYRLHKFGLKIQAFEAGSDFGGA